MCSDHRPKHLRGLPDGLDLSPEEERELMDLRTGLDRVRRRVASEQEPGEELWGFPVPRPMALLFDRLPSPFTVQEALQVGEQLGMDAEAVEEAVEHMRQHELVTQGPRGYVRHEENRNWF